MNTEATDPFADSLHWTVLTRSIFCGGLSGILAGVVFLDIGSRIAMRIVTILNPEAKGILTDADQVVGAITVEGTFTLVVFFGIVGGIMAGGLWVVVREFLPNRMSIQVLLAGVVAALAGSFVVIESSNEDFRIFDPVVLNVVMFIVLVGLAGSGTAIGDRMLQSRLPSGSGAGVAYGILIGIAGALFLQAFASMFFESGAFVDSPPRVAGWFFVIAFLGALLSWTRYIGWRSSIGEQAGRWIGTIGTVGLVTFGAMHLMGDITDIL